MITISVSKKDFAKTDKQMIEDFEDLKSDAKNLINRIQEATRLSRDFESKYHELPELLSAKDAFDEEKAELFEEEAKVAMEEIQRLVQEMNEIEEKVKSLGEEAEKLKQDLNNDRDLLKEAALEVEERFDIDIGPAPDN